MANSHTSFSRQIATANSCGKFLRQNAMANTKNIMKNYELWRIMNYEELWTKMNYEELLTRSNEMSIHQKHLRALGTEIYKSLADINPDFMKPYFKIKETPYNLRNGYALKLLSTNSTYYGINSVLFRACLLWNQLPLSIRQSRSLHEFISKRKTLKNIVCTCKICKTWFCNYVLWTNTTVIMISIIFQGWFLLAWTI